MNTLNPHVKPILGIEPGPQICGRRVLRRFLIPDVPHTVNIVVLRFNFCRDILFRCIERSRMKCIQYWPESSETQQFEMVEVTHQETLEFEDHVERTFCMKHKKVSDNNTPLVLKWYNDQKSLLLFSSDIESVFAEQLNGKILSFDFYPKFVYFEHS